MMTVAHLLRTGSILALLAATPALAQEGDNTVAAQSADVTAGPDEDESGDVIVVTAQLREQDPIEVPIALTAYSGDFLDELGLEDFEDLSRFVPGFDVQNQSPNNPGFSIRGITSDSGQSFIEPRVSVYQDGVSISKSRGSFVELFDLERVEVARGPQSTLYGRGALIGAVNIIQNKARTDRFEGRAVGRYGNFDSVMAEGMVNVPIGGVAGLRLSGRYREREGDVENLLGGEDFNSVESWAVRAAGRVELGERITFDLIGNYQEDHPAGTAFRSLTFRPTDPATGAVIGGLDIDGGAALSSSPGFLNGRDLGLDRKVYGATGLIRAELSDALTLNSITAYREFHAFEVFDADGTSLPILSAAEDADGEQFSQEFRLTFDGGGPITAFVGASYFREEGSQATPVQFDERILLARLAGALSGPTPGRPASDPAALPTFGSTAFTGALLRGVAGASGVALSAPQATAIAANLKPAQLETATNFSELEAFDIFGDITFKVSEQFEIGAGLRYTRDDKRSGFSSATLNGRSILGGFIGALSQPAATRAALLGALSVPGAANIPTSAAFPVPLFGLAAQPTAGNGGVDEAELEDDGFTYRLFARYAPTPDSSIFATYARGRRPRILSALPPSAPFGPARFNEIAAETVDSFEVGAKAALMDRKLFVDGSVFYYRYDNFQTTEQQGTIFVTTNAGEAESYGFEGAFRYRQNANVSLFGTYAYNHSRFQTGTREGNRFRLSPDHSLSLGAIVGGRLGAGKLELIPSVTFQSRVFFDDDNDLPALQRAPQALVPDLIQDELQDEYALVNVRVAYTFDDPGIRLELFADNLLGQDYIKDAGNTGDAIGLPTFIPGEPRLYGIQASVKF
jgi:outer membrane receptor protein involved in Fe transport